MAEFIAFTNNYTDRSTNTGFQFEFFCDRCHDGMRSTFQSSALGTASAVLDAASSFLGSFFGASSLAHSAQDATRQQAHDAALRTAIQEVRPHFVRCTRCTGYVCPQCWNEAAGLCANCAPDMGGELAAVKADVAVQQMREQVYASQQFSGNIAGKHTTCPCCGTPTGDMKFCGDCGTPVALRRCPAGHEVGPGLRFCGECGTPVA